MQVECKQLLDEINNGIEQMLSGKTAKLIDTQNVPDVILDLVCSYNRLASSIKEIMGFILPLAHGNLNIEPPRSKNVLASPFKELHSRLLNLIWQTQQIAQGDYSQRIDFMGDFSQAFNSMVEELRRKDWLLNEQIRKLTLLSDKLRENELRYKTSFYHSTEAAFIFDPKSKKILETNAQFGETFGYNDKEATWLTIFDLLADPESFNSDIEIILKTSLHNVSQKIKKKDGSHADVEMNTSWIEYGNKSVVIVNITDVTEQLQLQQELIEREEQLRLVLEGSNDGFWDWNHYKKTIQLSRRILDILDRPNDELFIEEDAWDKLIYSEDLPLVKQKLKEHMESITPNFEVECRMKTMSGQYKWICIKGKKVMFDQSGKPVRMAGTFIDITERKTVESRLKFLGSHDSLTNLYNRAYFEQILYKLKGKHGSVGIIVCDVDGLKLINDTMGHEMGDTILKLSAKILLKSAGPDDIVIRIGGDEFVIILPNCKPDSPRQVCSIIKNNINEYNENSSSFEINMSLGYSYTEDASKVDVLFREADNQMYRDKLLMSGSSRSRVVDTIMQMLKARDYITEGHADRLEDLVIVFAKKIGISEPLLSDLRLFSKFHDIGKVGIPDNILNKKGPLNNEEMAIMRRHCEIGYRICMSLPDLTPISDLILKHHEWWSGNGYPLGLKGEDIPIECRILAVIDAYDAMTNDRPYRKALSHDQAIAELLKCAGGQFDPYIVEQFVKLFE